MAKQTVTLRLDEDDLTYLSQTEIAGAANFSEKIRALLAQARQLREGMENFASAHEFARDLFARAERAVSSQEIETGLRSELIHRVLAWLPEITALVLSSPRVADDKKALELLTSNAFLFGFSKLLLTLIYKTL
jgi:hypothetical protein